LDDEIVLNGIDAATGRYLVPPMSTEEAVVLASGRPLESSRGAWLRAVVSVLKRPKLGLPMDVEPTNLARAGWALVMPAGIAPEVRAADAKKASLLEKLHSGAGARPSAQEIAATWVERNDAQNYVLLGDPAVRLRTDVLT
jgi:hypothetical protein